MSKKLTFSLRQWQILPYSRTAPRSALGWPELDAVLTRLASYNRRGRLVSQEIIFN